MVDELECLERSVHRHWVFGHLSPVPGFAPEPSGMPGDHRSRFREVPMRGRGAPVAVVIDQGALVVLRLEPSPAEELERDIRLTKPLADELFAAVDHVVPGSSADVPDGEELEFGGRGA